MECAVYEDDRMVHCTANSNVLSLSFGLKPRQTVIIPAKAFARDYVITGVRLSVCLSVCLFVTTITK